MTREQAEQEYRKLLQEHVKERENIMREAKEAGTLEPGLDGNRALFKEVTEKFIKKINELQASIDK